PRRHRHRLTMAGPREGEGGRDGRDGRRRGPVDLAAVTGVLTLAYVVAVAADLMLLGLDPVRYNEVHAGLDGPVPRLLLGVVALGVVVHAADGVGRAALDLRPVGQRVRRWVLAGGRFVGVAGGIPLAAAVVWPAVRAWWVQ